MSYQVSWDNDEHDIIHIEVQGILVAKDLYEIADENFRLQSEVDYPVDVILDLSHTKFEMNGFIPAIGYANKHTAPTQRLVVIIGKSSLVKMMMGVTNRIAPKVTANNQYAESVEEAFHLITQFRQKERVYR